MFKKIFNRKEKKLLEFYKKLNMKEYNEITNISTISHYSLENVVNLINKIKIYAYTKNKKWSLKIKSIPKNFTYKIKRKKHIRMDFIITALIVSVQELNKKIVPY